VKLSPVKEITSHLYKETGVQNGEEGRAMSPSSLNDDMVKLVSYTIVSLKRDAERIMPGGSGSILVTDNMSGEAFASWMIARYLQSDDYEKLEEGKKLAKDDEKYLRIDYVVSRRWPRQPLRFEERQVEVLRQISKGL
jgi:hypothetical protein